MPFYLTAWNGNVKIRATFVVGFSNDFAGSLRFIFCNILTISIDFSSSGTVCGDLFFCFVMYFVRKMYDIIGGNLNDRNKGKFIGGQTRKERAEKAASIKDYK